MATFGGRPIAINSVHLPRLLLPRSHRTFPIWIDGNVEVVNGPGKYIVCDLMPILLFFYDEVLQCKADDDSGPNEFVGVPEGVDQLSGEIIRRHVAHNM